MGPSFFKRSLIDDHKTLSEKKNINAILQYLQRNQHLLFATETHTIRKTHTLSHLQALCRMFDLTHSTHSSATNPRYTGVIRRF